MTPEQVVVMFLAAAAIPFFVFGIMAGLILMVRGILDARWQAKRGG